MKIAIYIHCLIGGGAERVTVNLATELVERGHDITIVLNKEIIDYKLDKRIHLSVMPVLKDYSGYNIIRRVCYSIYNHFYEYKGVKNSLEDIKPDIIIASWGCKLWALLINHQQIPIVASEHNTFERKHTFKEIINRFFLNRFCDKVVVLTKYDKMYVKNYLKNTIVIPNPLSYKPITHDENECFFSQRKNFLACGRINAYMVKGFDTLIIAYSRIASHHPDWDLDIVGAGSEHNIEYLKSLAAIHNIEDRVHFLGFSEHVDLEMKKHAVFILSSRSEGFGMVITEAMAMGCPCISFSLTGPREIIHNGKDGILVENQNIDELSKEMSRLALDASLRYELSKNALDSVNRFLPSTITDRWLNLFNEIL